MTKKLLTLSEWLDATSPHSAKTAKQREEFKAERKRVLEKAGTTIGTLRVARSRGSVGFGMLRRLAEATKDEPRKIAPPAC